MDGITPEIAKRNGVGKGVRQAIVLGELMTMDEVVTGERVANTPLPIVKTLVMVPNGVVIIPPVRGVGEDDPPRTFCIELAVEKA
jgi:hypothetical protein